MVICDVCRVTQMWSMQSGQTSFRPILFHLENLRESLDCLKTELSKDQQIGQTFFFSAWKSRLSQNKPDKDKHIGHTLFQLIVFSCVKVKAVSKLCKQNQMKTNRSDKHGSNLSIYVKVKTFKSLIKKPNKESAVPLILIEHQTTLTTLSHVGKKWFLSILFHLWEPA